MTNRSIPSPIKILVADDHELIIQGLKRIISFQEDMIIIGEANNGEEVLDLLKINKPDVVLLDFNMPLINGIDVLKDIKILDSSIKVIMLTIESDKKTVYEAIRSGADGYLLKESVGAEIVEAIRTVCEGNKYINKDLVSLFFMNIANQSQGEKNDDSILDGLSKRELEALMYISRGLSNKEIGQKLYISEKTVKNYITNLYRKINVSDRVQAAIMAKDNDIEIYYKSKFLQNI